jgi:hypothetical protein
MTSEVATTLTVVERWKRLRQRESSTRRSPRKLWVTVANYCTAPVVSIDIGRIPAGKGEFGVAVRDPVVGLIENTETLLEPALTTERNLPEKSTATEEGVVPAGKGELTTAVRAPVTGLIAYADMLFEPALAT